MDKPWEISIRRVENGFILKHIDEERGEIVLEEGTDREILLEDIKNTEVVTNLEIAMYNLLNEIKDFFGVHFSDHRKVNLVVKFEEE